jgi:hypothetical protein
VRLGLKSTVSLKIMVPSFLREGRGTPVFSIGILKAAADSARDASQTTFKASIMFLRKIFGSVYVSRAKDPLRGKHINKDPQVFVVDNGTSCKPLTFRAESSMGSEALFPCREKNATIMKIYLILRGCESGIMKRKMTYGLVLGTLELCTSLT